MANLRLKIGTVGPDPAYQDHDVIEGMNQRKIRHKHAERICGERKGARNSNGLWPLSSIWFDFHNKTASHKIERIARNRIRRTNLVTLAQDEIGPTPNARGEYMHVEQYVNRRMQSPINRMFGTPRAEVWFGKRGLYDIPDADLDALWTIIEARTPELESAHPHWGFSNWEMRNQLCITCDDMTDDEMRDLCECVCDIGIVRATGEEKPGLILQKRKRKVLRDALRGAGVSLDEADVLNPNTVVDVLDTQVTRSAVEEIKSALTDRQKEDIHVRRFEKKDRASVQMLRDDYAAYPAAHPRKVGMLAAADRALATIPPARRRVPV